MALFLKIRYCISTYNSTALLIPASNMYNGVTKIFLHNIINGRNNRHTKIVCKMTAAGIAKRITLKAYQPVMMVMSISVIMLDHAAPAADK